MTELDEESVWVARSRDGDPDAFADLVRTHQRMIHHLAFRMTGSLAEADDLAQETFVRAYRRISDFQSNAKFSSWLYRIALNLCLDWREREHRRYQANLAWAAQTADLAPTLHADETSELVQAALLRLPPKQRAVIILTVYDHLSHAEAASIVGCAEATVSWRVFVARRSLAKMLHHLSR